MLQAKLNYWLSQNPCSGTLLSNIVGAMVVLLRKPLLNKLIRLKRNYRKCANSSGLLGPQNKDHNRVNNWGYITSTMQAGGGRWDETKAFVQFKLQMLLVFCYSNIQPSLYYRQCFKDTLDVKGGPL